MPHKYGHRSVQYRQFLNWGSFIPSDSSLYHIDKNHLANCVWVSMCTCTRADQRTSLGVVSEVPSPFLSWDVISHWLSMPGWPTRELQEAPISTTSALGLQTCAVTPTVFSPPGITQVFMHDSTLLTELSPKPSRVYLLKVLLKYNSESDLWVFIVQHWDHHHCLVSEDFHLLNGNSVNSQHLSPILASL